MENLTFTQLLEVLLAGGLLGIIGQGIRIIVGLKKLDDQRSAGATEAFTVNRLLVSLFIGFIAGALAAIANYPEEGALSREFILGIIAAGYAGADFVEGVFNTFFKKKNEPASAGEPHELLRQNTKNRELPARG